APEPVPAPARGLCARGRRAHALGPPALLRRLPPLRARAGGRQPPSRHPARPRRPASPGGFSADELTVYGRPRRSVADLVVCSEGISGGERTLPKKGDALSARMPIQCCSLRRGQHEIMRWGDAKKAPPLTRSRGMFAASLLVVAVMATYASLAVISLTAGGSLPIPTSLPGKVLSSLAKSTVGWHEPSAKDVLGVTGPSSSGSQTVAFLDSPFVDFGPLPTAGAAPTQISVTNTSSAALPLALSVSAPGISASFAPSGLTHMLVNPHHAARISLTSDPRFAGPIQGQLVVSISKSGSQPLVVPLTGAQAPLPATGLTATPAAHGAVDL